MTSGVSIEAVNSTPTDCPPFRDRAICRLERRLRCARRMQARPSNSLAVHVTVVALNPETVDGLATYLDRSGVPTRGSCAVDQLVELASSSAAVVLFPDEFDAGETTSAIERLREARPTLFLVLVTKEPQRFGQAVRADGRSVAPLMLPKPSFGWAILDALRAHVASRAEQA